VDEAFFADKGGAPHVALETAMLSFLSEVRHSGEKRWLAADRPF
jgi:hypothetical protein